MTIILVQKIDGSNCTNLTNSIFTHQSFHRHHVHRFRKVDKFVDIDGNSCRVAKNKNRPINLFPFISIHVICKITIDKIINTNL